MKEFSQQHFTGDIFSTTTLDEKGNSVKRSIDFCKLRQILIFRYILDKNVGTLFGETITQIRVISLNETRSVNNGERELKTNEFLYVSKSYRFVINGNLHSWKTSTKMCLPN